MMKDLHLSYQDLGNIVGVMGITWGVFAAIMGGLSDRIGRRKIVFHVYDRLHLDTIPRRYTVEAGQSLSDNAWNTLLMDNGKYHLWVYGPNGFVRTFKGQVSQIDRHAAPTIQFAYDIRRASIGLSFSNKGDEAFEVTVTDNSYGSREPGTIYLPVGLSVELLLPVGQNGNWYDFTVAWGEVFGRRFAGRMETGQPSISDPKMGRARA